jgi:hypothetical protein
LIPVDVDSGIGWKCHLEDESQLLLFHLMSRWCRDFYCCLNFGFDFDFLYWILNLAGFFSNFQNFKLSPRRIICWLLWLLLLYAMDRVDVIN